MVDNAIARLYVHPHGQKLTKNAFMRFWEAVSLGGSELVHSTHHDTRRKTAVAGKAIQEDSGAGYEPEPCIELRLDKEYLSNLGVVFGHGQNCDVTLDLEDSHSPNQICITLDAQMRLIVQDLDSANGTEVTYSELSCGMRRNFRWIIGGDPFTVNKQIVHFLDSITEVQSCRKPCCVYENRNHCVLG